MTGSARREPLVLLALAATALVASLIIAADRFTWFMEVAPVLIGAPLLIASAQRFPLTPLLQLHLPDTPRAFDRDALPLREVDPVEP